MSRRQVGTVTVPERAPLLERPSSSTALRGVTLNLRLIARVLRRGAWILITMLLLGIATGAVLTMLATPSYQVTSTVYITVRGATTAGDLQAGNVYVMQKAPSYAALATSDDVLKQAVGRLADGTTVSQLRGSITVTARANSGIIDVFGGGDSPRETAARANAAASAIAGVINDADEQPASASAGDSTRLSVNASVVQPATVPTVAVAPQPRYNLFAGAVAGLAIGVGILVVRHALDSRVYTLADLPADRSLLVRASIPPRSRRAPRNRPDPAQVESYRTLRAALQYGTEFPRSIAVIGSGTEADAAAVTDNLGGVLAEVGLRVLLLDAVLSTGPAGRRDRVDDDETAIGLAQVLTGAASVEQALRFADGSSIVRLGAGGTAQGSSHLLSTPAMRDLLQELERRFDAIVVRCPPLAERADALAVAAVTAATLLVAQGGSTRRAPLRSALGLLVGVRARSTGIVLQNGYTA